MLNVLINILTILILILSVVIVVTPNPVYSAFSLITIFLCVGTFWYLINWQFVGLLLIILYAGAVAILFLFIIFTISITEKKFDIFNNLLSSFFIFFLIFKLSLMNYLSHLDFFAFTWYSDQLLKTSLFNFLGDAHMLGIVLYNHYLFIFWLIGVFLCNAMLILILLTRNSSKSLQSDNNTSI